MSTDFSERDLILRLKYLEGKEHILVDVGAHVGSFAKPFAAKGWSIVAFEPEPTNYKELCVNLQEFCNVMCFEKAVADRSGENIPFYVSSEHWGIHSLKPFHSTHQTRIMVEAVRLDKWLAEVGVNEITVLKIDVEGADFLVIKSFDFNKFHPEVVICEFMDKRTKKNFGYTYHDVVAYMDCFKYKAFVSEWEPIVEYSRRNVVTASPKFMKCLPYPLDHSPAWGNLIFIPEAQTKQFEYTLSAYLKDLKRAKQIKSLCSGLSRIPGARTLYNTLRNMHPNQGDKV